MNEHDQRLQTFVATGGCNGIQSSQAAIDARRVMLRPVRSSADELCPYLATVGAGFEQKLVAANLSATEMAAFRREFYDSGILAIMAESCAAQVKQLAACDEQLALLAAHFGHWTVDAGLAPTFDATVSAEALAAYDKTVEQLEAANATILRLEQRRMAPKPPN